MSRLFINPPDDIHLSQRFDVESQTETPFRPKKYLKAPQNLCQLLDRLEDNASGCERVTLDTMFNAVGRRSFGALILLPGLIAMSPLSGIPTLPSILGLLIVLIAGQLLVGRSHFWLPDAILQRSVDCDKFLRGISAIRPIARFVDRLIGPRLMLLTRGVSVYVIALICVVIGATMPPLEIVPFLATTAGAALTVFSLSLIARDGLLALIGFGFTGGALYLIVTQWPF
ncbi:exopolysaccharide biosynthesis protein [Cerasicoccus frondis]|uniref:exopolysaccharide biosynthesis protein n=1 Tax=Cerasicoccus frondis TaxID=490090 RepID=UPI0028529215|nr:exopolysaccharide biosynthesis protein [Cerasicoccus frondis]